MRVRMQVKDSSGYQRIITAPEPHAQSVLRVDVGFLLRFCWQSHGCTDQGGAERKQSVAELHRRLSRRLLEYGTATAGGTTTWCDAIATSALGQKCRFERALATSASRPKADIRLRRSNRRNGPDADMSGLATLHNS